MKFTIFRGKGTSSEVNKGHLSKFSYSRGAAGGRGGGATTAKKPGFLNINVKSRSFLGARASYL